MGCGADDAVNIECPEAGCAPVTIKADQGAKPSADPLSEAKVGVSNRTPEPAVEVNSEPAEPECSPSFTQSCKHKITFAWKESSAPYEDNCQATV